uniref:Uncharacterized protein n=1 Tax=Arundo donax TaxID=35708 RepID=A0A0A9HQ80_ARUDO
MITSHGVMQTWTRACIVALCCLGSFSSLKKGYSSNSCQRSSKV